MHIENKKSKRSLSPIIVFVYNRPKETKLTIEALKKNYLAKDSDLYIFSDGAKKEHDKEKIEEVREFIHSISGFNSVIIKESRINKGLAKSIIEGVTEVINLHGSVIVLEDDLVTSENFLDFMNEALNFYKDSEKIISISGYTPPLNSLSKINKDFYFAERISSLGWGTWKNKWEIIDWEILDYNTFKKDLIKNYQWFQIGSDLPGMLKKQMEGKINSWAIRWCYHQFKNKLVTVYTSISKVNHIGDGENATNAKDQNRFFTELDNTGKRYFIFDDSIILNKRILKDFRNNYSIIKRLRFKIKGLYKF